MMKSDDGWTEVGGAAETTFVRWHEPGIVLEGVWRGPREGKLGLLGEIDDDGTRILFPLPVCLKERLISVKIGDLVRIRYVEDRKGKTGFVYKVFVVQTKAAPGEIHEQRRRLLRAIPDDDDLPF